MEQGCKQSHLMSESSFCKALNTIILNRNGGLYFSDHFSDKWLDHLDALLWEQEFPPLENDCHL